MIAKRVGHWSVEAPNQRFMRAQKPVWSILCDHYFRVEIHGWHRLPDRPCLLIGNHSGGQLTMDTCPGSSGPCNTAPLIRAA